MTDNDGRERGNSRFRALVLGAAAGGGLPQWNCGCENCRDARIAGSGIVPQTQSSLAVSVDGENWAVLNASPDIRHQLEHNPQLQPKSLRHSPVKSVLLTNGDIDHIAGLLILREKQPLQVFVTSAISQILDDNPVFRALDPEFVRREIISLDQPFDLLPGLTAQLFAVPGKVPLFMEDGEPDTRLEGEQTVGVEMHANGQRIVYIPGCAFIPPSLAARLDGASLVFFDGTVFTDDEMIRCGTGIKTGARMGHMAISGEGGSLEALRSLKIERIIYIHINNTNPIWREGPERDLVNAHGIDVGHDGMEITLGTGAR
ncbi:pyrroloquinoline quinone biosynthesis protein PqqB [Rhizobium sp. CFBP 8762]|uniref:pyrroloquinoline quinone biosynthesis protein PqqB n=1 Tax=Rhizobium sp. CFBP 8762 TaxID=2775279 RepID=UPI00177B5631|nr:pyrroloquinoline quinone biosynthesis protein PqqB [Rhizobium sp. CFBP 8762]MBD8554599.1 pyrroloquinoline quinone biosynthesis protein PqqB [Rhizobium sp. CFBP 8762]